MAAKMAAENNRVLKKSLNKGLNALCNGNGADTVN